MQAEGAALKPQVAPGVHAFLDATAALPDPATVYIACPDDGPCVRTAPDAAGAKPYDAEYFFTTKYGSPLSYARPLEVLDAAGYDVTAPGRILDFGYGYLGHLAMLSSLGHDVHGVEVDPILPVLYADHVGPRPAGGAVTLHHGRLFVDEGLSPAALGTFDLVMSKNVLKKGYIHPRVPPEGKTSYIDLGHDDVAFLQKVHALLRPGGWFLIYNLFPAQAPPGEAYIPWADGTSPFAPEAFAAAGLTVHAFDVSDDEPIRALAKTLGWDADMDLTALFARYTLAQRPAAPAPGG